MADVTPDEARALADGLERAYRDDLGRMVYGAASTATPNASKALRSLAAQVERLEADRRAVVSAWESLGEGHHAPWKVERWLVEQMKPAMDRLRAAMNEEPQDD